MVNSEKLKHCWQCKNAVSPSHNKISNWHVQHNIESLLTNTCCYHCCYVYVVLTVFSQIASITHIWLAGMLRWPAGTLTWPAGSPYRLVLAHFYHCLNIDNTDKNISCENIIQCFILSVVVRICSRSSYLLSFHWHIRIKSTAYFFEPPCICLSCWV